MSTDGNKENLIQGQGGNPNINPNIQITGSTHDVNALVHSLANLSLGKKAPQRLGASVPGSPNVIPTEDPKEFSRRLIQTNSGLSGISTEKNDTENHMQINPSSASGKGRGKLTIQGQTSVSRGSSPTKSPGTPLNTVPENAKISVSVGQSSSPYRRSDQSGTQIQSVSGQIAFESLFFFVSDQT